MDNPRLNNESAIQQILHTFPVIVLDGAMATELERYGCDLNDSLWSAKSADGAAGTD